MDKLKEIMDAVKAQGACHVRPIGCVHHGNCTEVVLRFLVPDEVLRRPNDEPRARGEVNATEEETIETDRSAVFPA